MPNRNSDILFQLIKSLQKAEKRNFKLYIKRSSNNEDLKVIKLFDAMDKSSEYDEKILFKKVPEMDKSRLSNLKTHLYKEVLASLRLLKSSDSIELELNEQLDYARILYNKGLYLQSLKILEKVKESASSHSQDSFLLQAISLEKKIEILHITRSMGDRADKLANEAIHVNERRTSITQLSNLALQLYSWYVKVGHARNEEEEKNVKEFFKSHMPANTTGFNSFYEKLYLYQSYCWQAFICQDFLMYYRYSQKWINLFEANPAMIEVETGHYVKGLHNLLNAHFDLRNFKQFDTTLNQLEEFANSPLGLQHDNFKINCFIYINVAKLNNYLMTGTFSEGLKLVSHIEDQLKEYEQFIDEHRILVFNYKIAVLHYGCGNFDTAIDYLHKIINENVSLRTDLQCYARLMHLMAHYELGNTTIIESLIKSVFRYMAKMKNFTVVEEEIFKFLRKSFFVSPRKLKPEFELLLNNIKHYEKNRFETRSFAYLDIISWLEAKVYGKTMSEVVHEKYKSSKHCITIVSRES